MTRDYIVHEAERLRGLESRQPPPMRRAAE